MLFAGILYRVYTSAVIPAEAGIQKFMEILEKLFGSGAKVKLIRMFVFNPGDMYDMELITDRTRLNRNIARKEIKTLEDICLVKKKSIVKQEGKTKKRKTVWYLNENFSYLKALHTFLLAIGPLHSDDIIKRVSKAGKIKLLIISGVFIQESESRVDMLVVGDNLKKGPLETAIKSIEAEIGSELKYSSFATADFEYRLRMFDKLVRDILDYPHRKLIDKMNVS